MQAVLLIDSRIYNKPYINYRKPSVDYILFNYYTDTFNSLYNKIPSNKYNQIGLVQHADFTSGFNILRKETTGSNSDIPPYHTFTSLLTFLTNIKSKGIHTFDFLGCELYDPVKTPAIFTYLETASGIDLRASTNLTGSAPGDWIMESDNVNIKLVYWTDEIDQYKGTLYAHANFVSSGLTNVIKDINGNIIFLNKDIYGRPLNPTIDSMGVQIKNIPSSVIVWGAKTYGGDTTIPTDVTDLLTSNVVAVYSNDTAFTALKSDGSLVYWGSLHAHCTRLILPPINDNFVAIYSNIYSFAGLRANGTVATWGGDICADISNIEDQLNTGSIVVAIYFNGGAFCALKAEGTVVIWGPWWQGGTNMPDTVNVGSPVVEIYASYFGWAVLKADGTVVSWTGNDDTGQPEVYDTSNVTNVKVIYTNKAGGFAALTTDETVVAWGAAMGGGIIPDGLDVTNVKTIYSTAAAFAALKNDGSVVAWGREDIGGLNPQGLTNVKTIYSNLWSFAALRVDGRLFAWGDENSGGTVPENVSDVVAVYSTDTAFAALKKDSYVVTWGNENEGGVVPEGLTNVATIFSNMCVFVALTYDNTLVAWGVPSNGAHIGTITPGRRRFDPPIFGPVFDTSNTVTVYPSSLAFVALKSIDATTPVGPRDNPPSVENDDSQITSILEVPYITYFQSYATYVNLVRRYMQNTT